MADRHRELRDALRAADGVAADARTSAEELRRAAERDALAARHEAEREIERARHEAEEIRARAEAELDDARRRATLILHDAERVAAIRAATEQALRDGRASAAEQAPEDDVLLDLRDERPVVDLASSPESSPGSATVDPVVEAPESATVDPMVDPIEELSGGGPGATTTDDGRAVDPDPGAPDLDPVVDEAADQAELEPGRARFLHEPARTVYDRPVPSPDPWVSRGSYSVGRMRHRAGLEPGDAPIDELLARAVVRAIRASVEEIDARRRPAEEPTEESDGRIDG